MIAFAPRGTSTKASHPARSAERICTERKNVARNTGAGRANGTTTRNAARGEQSQTLYPMRTLLLISVLASVAARGAEAGVPTLRQKLHAKILESVPPPPPPMPVTEQKEAAGPPVTMKSVIVSESKVIRDAVAAVERKDQERREQQFTPLNGGTLYNIGGMQLGGWWAPGEGWTFLRLNKAPTYRQITATEARMKELKELQNFGKSGEQPKSSH